MLFILITFPMHQVLEFPTYYFRVGDIVDLPFFLSIDNIRRRRGFMNLQGKFGFLVRCQIDFIDYGMNVSPFWRVFQLVGGCANLFQNFEGTIALKVKLLRRMTGCDIGRLK